MLFCRARPLWEDCGEDQGFGGESGESLGVKVEGQELEHKAQVVLPREHLGAKGFLEITIDRYGLHIQGPPKKKANERQGNVTYNRHKIAT